MSDYDATAKGYLARARDCLLRPDPALLFYAALELRFCVEQRQDAYVHAQRRYLKSVPRAYKIGHQHTALKHVFDREQIAQVAFEFHDIAPVVLHFTPVTSALKNSAERLGDLLHVRSSAPKIDDPWWESTRQELLKVYRMAWIACQGEMLCPIIRDRNNAVIGMIEIVSSVGQNFYDRILEIGRSGTMTIDYIDTLPGRMPDL